MIYTQKEGNSLVRSMLLNLTLIYFSTNETFCYSSHPFVFYLYLCILCTSLAHDATPMEIYKWYLTYVGVQPF